MFCEMCSPVPQMAASSVRILSIRNRVIGIDGHHQGRQLAVAAAETIVDEQQEAKNQGVDRAVELRRMDRQAPRQGAIDGQFDRLGLTGRTNAEPGMLAMLVEQMAKLPDRAHFAAGNAFHPLACANAGRGLGRLPPDMADRRPPGRRCRQSPGRRSSAARCHGFATRAGRRWAQNETSPPLSRSSKSSLSMPSTAAPLPALAEVTFTPLISTISIPARQPFLERRASRGRRCRSRADGPARRETSVRRRRSIPCSASC